MVRRSSADSTVVGYSFTFKLDVSSLHFFGREKNRENPDSMLGVSRRVVILQLSLQASLRKRMVRALGLSSLPFLRADALNDNHVQ